MIRVPGIGCAAFLALFAIARSGSPAIAENYPQKPVRLVVGFTAGGPTDLPARMIAEGLSKHFDQRVFVENKPGASSMRAAGDVFAQPADGYSILVCSYLDPVNTQLSSSAAYKLDDIKGVTPFSEYSYAIAIANDVPADTWAKFVDYPKANPGKLNYGHLGDGSSQNIVGKQLSKVAGIDMVGIPYKGAVDAMLEVATGRLHLFIGPPLVVKPFFDDKRVKVIATTGAKRLSIYPGVPTLVESGTSVQANAWLGICVKKGTPEDIVVTLNKEVIAIANTEKFRNLIESSGSKVITSSPAEFDGKIKQTATDAAPIIEEFHLKQ